jgi:DNA ligase D-like protein (predicted polymerase)/DNA ligase D-like protein (predicted 3'-phosphoesterase)
MALSTYKQKRSFDKTPEPTGGRSKENSLLFVIQKHQATHLHYDFRLELRGVLKSWAVPKGPSLNPADKRLAMLVEDHPFDYKDFEGVIPAGNYGAGTVIIWDKGEYEPLEPCKDKKEQEKVLLKGFHSGSLKIRMKGKKLKGEFALVRTSGRGDNSWLLIKHKDKFAGDTDITRKDKSVVSKLTLEQMASKTSAKKWISNKDKSGKLKPAAKSSRQPLLNLTENDQTHKIAGHKLTFSNLNKKYWPKEGYTKRDMLNYYYQVAPFIMPYLKDRPQSLNRYPNGITGHSFYHKDLTGQATEWMQLFPYHTSDGKDKNFIVPTNETALLYMANLGAIEMNPWNSTIHKPDNPDWCLIDLDPTDENTFEQVIETALVTKEVLDALKVKGYAKTSGSTGIHIYIPLGAKYSYDECQLFGKLIATQVHQMLPAFTSIERLTKNRKGKIYVDYLQNRPKATLAAAYSLRPKPGATVSMPLHWEEVRKGLKMKDFNIENALDRINEQGDLFKPVLGKGINIEKALTQLEKMVNSSNS